MEELGRHGHRPDHHPRSRHRKAPRHRAKHDHPHRRAGGFRRPVRHRARRHRPTLRLDRFDRIGAQDARGRAAEDRRLGPARRPADDRSRQHTLLFRARRGIAVALAVAEMFSRAAATSKACRPRMRARRWKARKRPISRSFCQPRLTFRPSAFASYLLQLIDSRRRGAERHRRSRTSCSTRRRMR